MNFAAIEWGNIVPYFGWAVIIVGGLYKAVTFYLGYRREGKKAALELNKINRSESAEFHKADLEHKFKLEELADKKIKQILEFQQEEIDDLKAEIEVRDGKIKEYVDAENARKQIYLQKLFMLRESQRELGLLEAEILKLQGVPEFQAWALKSIEVLKSQTAEHEKLLT